MSFGLRVFDTVLDGHRLTHTSLRNAADYWEPFCLASGWSFSFERIHSLNDLSYFMNRKIKEDIIIFSGHGNVDGWQMTNKEKLNADTIDNILIHKDNIGKDIIFSACLMANSNNLCTMIKDKFSARRLFAYRHIMQDRFCFLNESILLTLIEKNRNFTRNNFDSFKEYTKFMKNLNQQRVHLHPMEMY